MFNRKDDFDDVKKYKKQQELQNRQKEDRFYEDDRFLKRDDFFKVEYNEVKKSQYEKKYRKENKINDKKQSRAYFIMILIGLVIAISSLVFFDNDVEINDKKPLTIIKVEAMNAIEFNKESKIAKDNYLSKASDIKNFNSNQSFSTNIKNTEINNKELSNIKNLRCLYLNNENPIACAVQIFYPNGYLYPDDFMNYFNELSLSKRKTYYVSESNNNTIYFIKGNIYSHEFVELVNLFMVNK